MTKRQDERFSLASFIIDRIKPYLLSRVHPQMYASILGSTKEARPPNLPSPTSGDLYWIGWLYETDEILCCLDRLEHAVVYLSHFPPTKVFRFHHISEDSWIRYHEEMHLQEQYILSNRLRKLLKKVQRTASQANRPGDAVLAGNYLQSAFKIFQLFLKTRGEHVHNKRFEDARLSDLRTLVLLTRHGKGRVFRPFRKAEAGLAKDSLCASLSKSNRIMAELCIQLFSQLTPVLTACEPKS